MLGGVWECTLRCRPHNDHVLKCLELVSHMVCQNASVGTQRMWEGHKQIAQVSGKSVLERRCGNTRQCFGVSTYTVTENTNFEEESRRTETPSNRRVIPHLLSNTDFPLTWAICLCPSHMRCVPTLAFWHTMWDTSSRHFRTWSL
jgi:hypothetical protein